MNRSQPISTSSLWIAWSLSTIAFVIMVFKHSTLLDENKKLQDELAWWRCERQYQLPAEPKEVECPSLSK
jgi:hypothetical protein